MSADRNVAVLQHFIDHFASAITAMDTRLQPQPALDALRAEHAEMAALLDELGDVFHSDGNQGRRLPEAVLADCAALLARIRGEAS